MEGTNVPFVRIISMDLVVYLMEMMQLLPTATGAFHALLQLKQLQLKLPQQMQLQHQHQVLISMMQDLQSILTSLVFPGAARAKKRKRQSASHMACTFTPYVQ
jgi:hypothetical protein